MPDLPERQNFKEGKIVSASALTNTARMIPRTLRGVAGEINVHRIGDRLEIGLSQKIPATPESSFARHFVVIQELDDYLVCSPFCFLPDETQKYDPELGTKKAKEMGINEELPLYVHVAKPWPLQKAPWHDQTAVWKGDTYKYNYAGISSSGPTTRTVNVNGEDHDEEISPQYFPGDIIIARQCQTGLTAEMDDYTLEPMESVTVPIIWEDQNISARSWLEPAAAAEKVYATYFHSGIVSSISDVDATPEALQSADGVQEFSGPKRIHTADGSTGVYITCPSDNGDPELVLYYGASGAVYVPGEKIGILTIQEELTPPGIVLQIHYGSNTGRFTFQTNGNIAIGEGFLAHVIRTGDMPASVTGSRSGGTALTNLLGVLQTLGIITDNTTA